MLEGKNPVLERSSVSMNQYKRSEGTPRSSEKAVHLKPGHRLGRYELVSPVGAGGMGRVWAARDTLAPGLRLVAVKTALKEAASDPEAERLFTDEARLASLVQHPNVCQVFELGKEHGALYLVMAWCDGGSLREVLSNSENHRLSPELAAGIVARVAAGLHAAHELKGSDGHPLGVVHRDVSPQNILITSTGHVMVADFGIARARGQLHRPTETGEIKGKLSYLAPEQITTRECDRRADVFAAGCVLYEASVGVRAFHGSDALATMYQILERGVEPPSKVLPDYPPELERIVLKALAKSPDARYQTAEELELELEEWLAQNRKVVSERLIAEALRSAIGANVQVRNQAIQEAIDAFDRRPTEETTLVDETSPDFSEPPPDDAQRHTLSTVTATDRRPGHRKTKAILASVGVVAGLAAAIIALGGKPREPTVVEGPTASGLPTSFPATTGVSTTDHARPADGTLKAATSVASADTHERSSEAVPAPDPSAAQPAASAPKRPGTSKPRPTPALTPSAPEPRASATPEPKSPAEATSGKGKRRELDRENPF
jgi:serine/threonine protein kinase